MQYAYIMPNDFINGEGVSVSIWMQGCPFHCSGCHNPELWNFEGGKDEDYQTIINKLETAITNNSLERNLSILGGEPLCMENLALTKEIIKWFKLAHPKKNIYLWTGYYFNELSDVQKETATLADVIIDGRYLQDKRDISLHLRGSQNQSILKKGEHY